MTDMQWKFVSVVGGDALSISINFNGSIIDPVAESFYLCSRNDSGSTIESSELVED